MWNTHYSVLFVRTRLIGFNVLESTPVIYVSDDDVFRFLLQRRMDFELVVRYQIRFIFRLWDFRMILRELLFTWMIDVVDVTMLRVTLILMLLKNVEKYDEYVDVGDVEIGHYKDQVSLAHHL